MYKLSKMKSSRFRQKVEEVMPISETELQILVNYRTSVQKLLDMIEKSSSPDTRHKAEALSRLEDELLDVDTQIDVYTCRNLNSFRLEDLSDEQFEEYYDYYKEYIDDRNQFIVVEAFTWFVDNGIAPPAWVLCALGNGLKSHVENPEPTELGKQLGLVGDKQGKNRPVDQHNRRISQRPAIFDMFNLITEFGLSKTDAARAATIKHKLLTKPKTLVNIYDRDFKEMFDMIPKSELMDSYTRTNYVRTFPLDARPLLAKRVPAKS